MVSISHDSPVYPVAPTPGVGVVHTHFSELASNVPWPEQSFCPNAGAHARRKRSDTKM